ncbi:MAG: hypothetical protein J6Z79_07555 [Clostridia bacterium]|nr:hypothetical protein [Clostridia bacterium]
MKTKWISLFLCLLILAPLFTLPASALTPTQAADVDGDGAVTARDAAILARHAACWDGYVDENGGLTYPWKERDASRYIASFDPARPVYFEDGYTFRVLTYGGADDGVLNDGSGRTKFKTTHFSVKDVCPWTSGSWSDTSSYARYYTKISEVVTQRNKYLKDTYNITVEEERVYNTFDTLKIDSLCGLDSYDAVMLPLGNYYNYASIGYVQNVCNIPTIDLSAQWYDADLLSGITFDNALYYLTGASDSAVRQSVFLPAIGLTNVQQSFGLVNVAAAADFIYDKVLDGDWTIETMLDVVNTCYNHYSGTEPTHYKVGAETRINFDQMMSAGFESVYHNGSAYTFYDSFSACPGYEAWAALKPLLASERDTSAGSNIYSGTKSTVVIRYIGSTVYAYNSQMRSSGYALAILPDAKGSAAQEKYRMNPGMGFCYLYAIPKYNHADGFAARYGFDSGKNLAGYLMSAYMEASLGKHNSKGYDVRDAFIQQLAALPGLHNSEYGGKPLQTLELIFNSIYFERGMVLSSDLYDKFKSAGNDESKWDALATSYASNIDTLKGYASNVQDYLALE